MEKFFKYIWSKSKSKNDYWLTRFVFLRLLGFVYLFAFISLATQVIPLIGENGLLPAENFLDAVDSRFNNKIDSFNNLPTIFWFHISNTFILTLAWLGVILSLILLIGYANVPLLFILWFLYLSFVHIGQLFYSYGWEIQLLETGLLAVFMVPFLDLRPFPKLPPPVPIIWLLRWLTFRIHLGSGLIKYRGDSCWKDLTCLFYHYETQPIPNPLSPWFHFLPKLINKIGVLWSHFIQLIVPFFIFWPKLTRNIAGLLLLSFQFILILSGNLSFLNWITVVAIIGCFDDKYLRIILPKFITKKADQAAKNARFSDNHHTISWIVLILVALLSTPVIINLFSSNQAMNTSFNQLHLVNTYGAFGSIGKVRNELIIQGTTDTQITPETEWKEYEFKAKPGNVNRKLPIIAPYQPRIDWQIWFAAFSRPEREPWLIHFIWKLLHNDAQTLTLISHNPFPENSPNFIRVQFYNYKLLPSSEDAVWNRTLISNWLPPLSKLTPELQDYIAANNWE